MPEPDRDAVRAQLAALIENPDRIPDLSRDRAAEFLTELAALGQKLENRILYRISEESSSEPSPDDRLLKVPEAAELLSVSPDWIYKRSDDLPFVRKIGPQTTRVSERGLQEHIRNDGPRPNQ